MSVRFKWLVWAPRTASDTFDPSTQAHIKWWDTDGASTTLNWGTTNALGSNAASSYDYVITGTETIHYVLLSGLQPDTDYYFRGTGDADIRKFRTAPAKGYSGAISFIEGSDLHHPTNSSQTANSIMVPKGPRFVVFAGDVAIDSTPTSMASFLGTVCDGSGSPNYTGRLVDANGYTLPIVPCVGNHEWSTSDRNYETCFETARVFSVQVGNMVFVVGNQGMGETVATMATKFETMLKSLRLDPTVRWIYAVYHYPCFSSTAGLASSGTLYDQRVNWGALFERYGVNAAFCGHDHQMKFTMPIFRAAEVTGSGTDRSTSDRLGWRELGDGTYCSATFAVNNINNWFYDHAYVPSTDAGVQITHAYLLEHNGFTCHIKDYKTTDGTLVFDCPISAKTAGFLYFDSRTTGSPESFVDVATDNRAQVSDTVTLWAYIRYESGGAGGGNRKCIVAKQNASVGNYGLFITTDSAPANRLTFIVKNGASATEIQGPVITPNQDLFVAVRFTMGASYNVNNIDFFVGATGGTISRSTTKSTDYTSISYAVTSMPDSAGVNIHVGGVAVNAMSNATDSSFFNGFIGPCGVYHGSLLGDVDSLACPTWTELKQWAADTNTIAQFGWNTLGLNGTTVTELDATGKFTATHRTGHVGAVADTAIGSLRRGSMSLEGDPTAVMQYGYPISDVTVGAWAPTPLYASIDEVTVNDADYIYSPDDPANAECEVGLGELSAPVQAGNVTLKYRYRSQGSGTRQVNIRAGLYQGSTKIAEKTTPSVASGWTDDSIVLQTAEVAAITNWADLRVRLAAISYLTTLQLIRSMGAIYNPTQTQTIRAMANIIRALGGWESQVLNTQSADLMGFYRLAENAGASQVLDASLKGYHSTAVNSTTLGVASSLIGDTAAQFDAGSSIQLETTAAPRFQMLNFTVLCWFKRTATGTTASTGGTAPVLAEPLVTKGMAEQETLTQDINFFLGIDPATGTLAADYECSASGPTPSINNPLRGATALSNGTWYMGAITYDGANFKIYLNGVQDATVAAPNAPGLGSISPTTLGRAALSTNTLSGQFLGVMDEVAIWKKALTAQELLDLYAAGNSIRSQTIRAMAKVTATNSQTIYSMANLAAAGMSTATQTIRSMANIAAAATYQSLVAATEAANLVGYYRLEESAGATQALDSSGNGYHSTNSTGNPTYGATGAWATSKAATFASAKYIQLEAAGTSATRYRLQNFTINLWAYRTGTGTAANTGTGGYTDMEPLVTKGMAEGETTLQDINFFLGWKQTGNVGFDFELNRTYASGTADPLDSINRPVNGGTLVNNTWYMLTATFDATALVTILYVNGSEVARRSVERYPSIGSYSPACIGTASLSTGATRTGNFVGLIDEVSIWSKALTAAQIQALYTKGSAGG